MEIKMVAVSKSGLHNRNLPTRNEEQPDPRRRAFSYPPRAIAAVCEAVSHAGTDKEYVRKLFEKHEDGALTGPEKLLPHLLLAMASRLAMRVTFNIDEASLDVELLWPEFEWPLRVFEFVRESVGTGETTGWSFNYSLFVPQGLAPDPGLLQRAASLIAAIGARDPVDHEALLDASARLYDDMPQTWAAWDDATALAELRPPDEKRTFGARSWPEIRNWISGATKKSQQIVFLVPLVSSKSQPDLPGPADVTVDLFALLRMADAAVEMNPLLELARSQPLRSVPSEQECSHCHGRRYVEAQRTIHTCALERCDCSPTDQKCKSSHQVALTCWISCPSCQGRESPVTADTLGERANV